MHCSLIPEISIHSMRLPGTGLCFMESQGCEERLVGWDITILGIVYIGKSMVED
jgi:hypothetical protein